MTNAIQVRPVSALNRGSAYALIGDLLSRRPDHPPEAQCVDGGPHRESVSLEDIRSRVLTGSAVEKPLCKIPTDNKEGKYEGEIAKSDKNVATVAQANGTDEIANPNSFSPREITQTNKAADVNESAVDIPPIAGFAPWRGMMQGEQNQRHEALATRSAEQTVRSPAAEDRSTRYARPPRGLRSARGSLDLRLCPEPKP